MKRQSAIMADLRQSISLLERRQVALCDGETAPRIRFGLAAIDKRLNGGLASNDLHEVRCSLSRDIAPACGLVFALLARFREAGNIIWIADPAIRPDAGMTFPDGLAFFGIDAARLCHVRPSQLRDAIWAAGEAVATSGLAAVVLHIRGNPKSFDLTVSRKLMLRAQKSGTALFLLRQAGGEEASSAATRWHVTPSPSLPDENFAQGVGRMRLALTLEKNRNGQLGSWSVAWNPTTRSFEDAAQNPQTTHSGVPLYPSANGPAGLQEMGQVVAFEKAS